MSWYNGKREQDENKIDFSVIKEYWGGNGDLVSTAKLFLGEIQINTHFFTDTEIECDIDPREFKSIEDHYKLMDFLIKLSEVIRKTVYVTPENCPEIKLITIDGKNVNLNLGSDPSD